VGDSGTEVVTIAAGATGSRSTGGMGAIVVRTGTLSAGATAPRIGMAINAAMAAVQTVARTEAA
jgi:hypothetical protein